MWSKILLLISLYAFHVPSLADKVFWLPNKSIYLASNFEDGQLPCPGQTIVFPETVEESVIISSLSVSGLILPIDGEIIFEDGVINFASDQNKNCTRTGNTFYRDDQISSWAQPDVWSNTRFNKATPDAERVPCYNDFAYFPKKGQFTIKLPDRPQKVNTIMEVEQKAESELQLGYLINKQTNDQTRQFIETEPNMLEITHNDEACREAHGCACQYYALDIECKLKYCPQPQCSNPIKPEGHCCDICGASLLIEITEDFNMKSFEESVKTIIDSYGADKFEYHVGLLPQKYGAKKQPERVQVIVVDAAEYTGKCQQVITDINYVISKDWIKSNVLLLSGNPSTQSGEGGKIFISVFFLVVVAMAGIFAYYYKWSVSDLTDLRGGMTRGMLSRLRQRTESVMSLARRDSAVSTGTTAGTAFRNPLYSSIRERVQVAAVDEE